MAEIEHNDIQAHIEKCRGAGFDPVYLIHGDDYIRERVTEILLAALLPDPSARDLNLETVESTGEEGIYDAIERVATRSFLSSGKIVHLKDSGVFSTGVKTEKQIEKIKEAHEQGNSRRAAGLFLEFLSRRKGDLAAAASGDIAKGLNLETGEIPALSWLCEIARYCLEKGLSPESRDAAGALKGTIERGFLRNHHLLLTTESADRRTALYKIIKSQGTVINCTVPQGSRKAEKDEQRRVLAQLMQQILGRHRKTADPGVFEQLFEKTGFDLRTFSGNLEKLIHFSGESRRITLAHVDRVIDRTRDDPVYALTGAIGERHAANALIYLDSLLAAGYHYLQLFSAIVNQIRRLLVIKTFTESPEGKGWRPGSGFDPFKTRVMPAVIKFDESLHDQLRKQENRFSEKTEESKPSSRQSELVIAKTPNNPYPIYQQFLQADRYSLHELQTAIIRLHEADAKLKTSGHTPKAVLEHLIFTICRTDHRS